MSIDHTKSKLSLTVTAVIALTLALAGAYLLARG